MTQPIPTELLDDVFQHLTRKDLFQCQKVCHPWYTPAHLLILKKVAFIDESAVDSFLEGINDNPLYPKAVMQLELGFEFTDDWIDPPRTKRLFASLTAINELLIKGGTSFMEDESIHTTIKQNGRDLRQIHYMFSDWSRGTDPIVNQVVKKLQDTLTDVELMVTQTVDFLTGFTRLKTLSAQDSRVFVNFQAWLPLFQREQFTLTSIKGTMKKEDKHDFFASSCTSPKDEQLLMDKLSALKGLEIEDNVLCPNSLKFLTQYFTGLTKFRLYSDKSQLSDQQIQAISNHLVDFIHNLEKSRISMSLVEPPMLALLPAIIRKIFHSSRQSVYGKLKMHIHDDDSAQNESFYSYIQMEARSVKIHNNKTHRSALIQFGINQTILDSIRGALASSIVNTLQFDFSFDFPKTIIPMLQDMLDHLPALKEVVLHVLGYCKPVQLQKPSKQYHQIELLQIDASSGLNGKMDMLSTLLPNTFEDFMWMFPNVRYLKLHYLGGFWKAQRLDVPLQHMNLDRLDLDVTPVLKKTSKIGPDAFFILCIQTKEERYLYKVTLDVLGITKLDKVMEQGCALVTVRVAGLASIRLYLYKDILQDRHHWSYLEECIGEVMET